MGIPFILQELTRDGIIKSMSLKDLKLVNKRVGIDATTWLIDASRRRDESRGAISRKYYFEKIYKGSLTLLEEEKITLVLVFDTHVPPSKAERRNERLLENNRNNKNNYVPPEIIEFLKRNKIDFIPAPYEADAQLSYLANIGYIDAVITLDSDIIACGVPKIIYEWQPSTLPGHCAFYVSSEFKKHKKWHEFTDKMILEMCILLGCDYLPYMPFKIGDKYMTFDLAYQLIQKHKSYKFVIHNEDIRLIKQGQEIHDKREIKKKFEETIVSFTRQQVYDPRTRKGPRLHHWNYDEIVMSVKHLEEVVGVTLEDATVLQIAKGGNPKLEEGYDFAVKKMSEQETEHPTPHDIDHELELDDDQWWSSAVEELDRRDYEEKINPDGSRSRKSSYVIDV